MISKEWFEHIVKQISSDMSKEPFSEVVWTGKSKLEFAKQLIKAVEAESEVVGYVAHGETMPRNIRTFTGCEILDNEEASQYFPECITKLIALPLVEGEAE